MRYIKSLELNYIWTFLNVVRCKDEDCPDPPYYCGRNCQGKTLVYYQKNRTRKFNLLLLIHRDLFFFLSRGIFCDSLPCRPVKSIICNGKCCNNVVERDKRVFLNQAMAVIHISQL